MEALEDLGFEKDVDYFYNEAYGDVRDKSLLRWDFRIETLGDPLFIEYDGGYHYEPIRRGSMTKEQAEERLKNTQRRDAIKNDYCEDNCLLLLRIPYWEKKNAKKLVSDFINTNLLIE
jgi:hypothetical protein